MKKKRGTYLVYDDQLRAKIGRYAAENGNKATVEKFSAELAHAIPESTVRNMKKSYLKERSIANYTTTTWP